MGMDLFGKAPTSEKGNHFRRNIWWWHPLWDYCVDVAPVARKVKSGHCNEGDGLNAVDAKRLAAILRSEIKSGRTAIKERAFRTTIEPIPDAICALCDGTGMSNSPVPKVRCLFTGEYSGAQELAGIFPPARCNGCGGRGRRAPAAASRCFDAATVVDFIEFLEHCGGFEIW
jgi:hypothetical protein